jgi:SAM-dependent methyltransferase
MPKFAAIRENYFDKIGLPITGRIHELGCGTGAVCRAIASRPGFAGSVVGSDLSVSLIETAKQLTAASGLKNIEYYQADGQGSDAHKGQYDLVLAHQSCCRPRCFIARGHSPCPAGWPGHPARWRLCVYDFWHQHA